MVKLQKHSALGHMFVGISSLFRSVEYVPKIKIFDQSTIETFQPFME